MISFQDYLEAKVGLDARSRHPEVHAAFIAALRSRSPLRILDAGSGTGAMTRRLAAEDIGGSVEITALDSEAASLAVARERLLAAGGLPLGEEIVVERPGRRTAVRFVQADLLDAAPRGAPFDAVMAHALMDILPLEPALDRFGRLLAPGGLLYATITYDGRTTLVPAARNAVFEEQLLAVYDRSMDDRRSRGRKTGGSRAASRLIVALAAAGFEVCGCGASDWSLYPFGGLYRDGDPVFLEAMLETMHAEGLRQGLQHAAMDEWLQSRLEDLRAARLGLIVHQLDVLARGGGA